MSISSMDRVLEAARNRGLNRDDILVMLPYHLRYYLPNRDYAYNGVIFGDEIKCSVIHLRDGRTRESASFKFDNPRWEEAVEMFQALANKKYPKPLRHKDQARRDELLRYRGRDRII